MGEEDLAGKGRALICRNNTRPNTNCSHSALDSWASESHCKPAWINPNTILTKNLGAEGYGIWSVIMVTVSLLSPLALLGLTSVMIRLLAAEKDKRKIIPFQIVFIGKIKKLKVNELDENLIIGVLTIESANRLPDATTGSLKRVESFIF